MNKEVLIEKLMDSASKVYFYCVKRCNNLMDAEDLSQTILLEVLTSINKGIKIDNFDYYLWAICKNQFNKYLREIVNQREHLDLTVDINEPADNISVLDEMIYNEDIKKLNQAIKLLSIDYNKILYAYYVEDKRLSYIAEEMNLPLGTVKRKLFEIRKKLKEYLEMETLSGKKAYVPVNFTSVLSHIKIGAYNPFDYVSTLINKNLLYHSYNNPCTLEDYSIEMGISKPYIEDIVKQLVATTLLKKTSDGKYLTNFPYVTKDILNYNNQILKDNCQEYTNELINFAKKHIDEYCELMTYASLTKEEAMWSFCLFLNQEVLNDVKPQVLFHERPGGGKWDFYITDLVEKNSLLYDMAINTYNDDANRVRAYAFFCPNDFGRLSFSKSANGSENYALFNELLHHGLTNVDSVVNKIFLEEKEEINSYINKGFLKIVDDKLKFNFPFFSVQDFKKVESLCNSQELDQAKAKLQVIVEKLTLAMLDYLPDYLSDYSDCLISSQLWNIQSLVLEAFREAKMLDSKLDQEFFPYNMIMITTDISKNYHK